MFDEKAFMLLQKVLYDTRALHFRHFSDWASGINDLDNNIRQQFKNAHEHYALLLELLSSLQQGQIISLKDSLQCRFALFRGEGPREFFSIGPFFVQSLTEKDWAFLQKQNRLTTADTKALKKLTASVPTDISRMEAIKIAKDVLEFFYGIVSVDVKKVDWTLQSKEYPPLTPEEDINVHAQKVEQNYIHEANLTRYVAQGNVQKAMEEATYFMHMEMRPGFFDTHISKRSMTYAANTVLRKAAASVNIPPLYVDEMSQAFARKISQCTSGNQLDDVYLEMIAEYCRLCREHSMDQYTPNTRKAINYIIMNLSADLSPQSIGEATGFSAGYLSRLIKSETGMTPVQFVTAERIRAAKGMLASTNLPVSDIANYVGIPDWNYFTKLFKKSEGCTPKDYRKQLQGK